MTQKLDREVSEVCNLSEGVMRKGVAKGKTERTLANLRSLMKNMGLSAEQAMTVLEVPEGERPLYRERLNTSPKKQNS